MQNRNVRTGGRSENSTLALPHMILMLSGLALAAGPHVMRVQWWVAAGVSTVFLWRLYIAWKDKPMPSKLLLTLTAIAGLIGVFMTFRTVIGRDAGVTLLVVLLALKLMEMRAARDVFVLIFVGYFLALTNFFYSQTILTGMQMLCTVLAITACLVSIQAPDRLIRANLRTAGTLLAQASPIMLLLFVLFPRVQGPLWGVPQDSAAGVTGLSDNMSPGTLSRLGQSDAIAFRVKFNGAPPPRGQLYWRGPVFWSFDGVTWRPGLQGQRGAPATVELMGEPIDYEVTLEAHDRQWLFGLEMPSRFPRNARMTPDFQLLSPAPIRTRFRYDMRSYTSYRAATDNPDEQRAALALPRLGNPRARGLAEEWRRNIQGDEAIMRAAIDYFRNGGFGYTLQPPLLDRNPVDEFLFDTKQGFCEHFASSFTYLMRAAGIPARVVTGYQGGEINPVDQYLEVRQADAHAWSEVWLKDRGWTRVDPTAVVAPVRLDGGLQAAVPQSALPLLMRQDFTWLRSWRNNWNALTNQWNQWVLGYTPDRQRDLISRLGMGQPDWGTLAHMLFWSVASVIGMTALWMLWRVRRKDPVQAAWATFCRRMERRGLPRQPSEGPLDYSRRVVASLPAQDEPTRTAVQHIAALYADLYYGRERVGADVTRLKQLVGAFRP